MSTIRWFRWKGQIPIQTQTWLTQGEIETLLVNYSEEIQSVIYTLWTTTRSSGPDGSIGEFYKMIKEFIILILIKSSNIKSFNPQQYNVFPFIYSPLIPFNNVL